MARPAFRRALVLGGIRSGKSEFAEGLLANAATVRYLATARRDPADPEWEARIEAHRARRSRAWVTEEVGDDPSTLPALLERASPLDALLVDDLGTWAAALVETTSGGDRRGAAIDAAVHRLVAAVRACPATLVLVSPEAGMSVVPVTESARVFVDALGATNRALAAECDAVALVVAGNAVPVKGGL